MNNKIDQLLQQFAVKKRNEGFDEKSRGLENGSCQLFGGTEVAGQACFR